MVGHLKEMDKNRDVALTAIAEMAYDRTRLSVFVLELSMRD